MGDDNFFNNNVDDYYIQNFISNKKENSLVISDSLPFKKEIKKLYENKDVFVFLDQPYHIGMNANVDDYLDTLTDFYLVQNASSVNCCSCYPFISNFVQWTSLIYDVPILNINTINTLNI